VQAALQQVRHPRQRAFRQGRADVQAACLGAPPQLRLHQPRRWQRRRRSGCVAPKRAAGRSETRESADVELRQDDGQELGGHDGQELVPLGRRPSNRRGGRGWTLEEGAQLLGDGQDLGGLPIGESRRAGPTLSGHRAQCCQRCLQTCRHNERENAATPPSGIARGANDIRKTTRYKYNTSTATSG